MKSLLIRSLKYIVFVSILLVITGATAATLFISLDTSAIELFESTELTEEGLLLLKNMDMKAIRNTVICILTTSLLLFLFFEYFTFRPIRRFDKTVQEMASNKSHSDDAFDRVSFLAKSIEKPGTSDYESQNQNREKEKTDSLTRLPNREAFTQKINNQISLYSRSKTPIIAGILLIDINAFKEVNDTFGLTIGNETLVAIAGRIKNALRNTDQIFRIGGNEFGAIISFLNRELDAIVAVEKILEQFNAPFIIENNIIYLSASVGISTFPLHGKTDSELIYAAELALHEAKRKRKGFRFFSKALQKEAERQVVLKTELHKALENREFRLYFQPQNDIYGKVIGCEVLVRWKSEKLGKVSPEEFIPILEETGLIIPLGEWILKSSLSEWKEWQMTGVPPVSISINISPKQLASENIIQECKKIVRESSLDPRLIHIELTESSILETQHSQTLLKDLSDIGLRIDLDDFGVGYSSLNRLKELPIDTLKIDKSFIDEINSSGFNKIMVKNIINLAHDMNMTVIAEGVEHKDQLEELVKLKCDTIQGFYFSRPLLPDEFKDYVLKQRL